MEEQLSASKTSVIDFIVDPNSRDASCLPAVEHAKASPGAAFLATEECR